MSTLLNPKILNQFMELALKNLKGDWIILGGTLLPALGVEHRSTIDIDFVSKNESSNSQLLQLMEIAQSLGLPIETINSAAAYFLKKIPDYSERLILLKKSKDCSILRPTLDLYFELKISRALESDIQDILKMIEYCIENRFDKEITDTLIFFESVENQLKIDSKNKSQIKKLLSL